MSFRAILFLSIVSAVIAAAFIEAGLDLLTDRARVYAEERVVSDLELYGDSVESQLRAVLDSPALPNYLVLRAPLERESRYRILRGERVLFESSPPPQLEEEQEVWRSQVRHLGDDYRVELEMRAKLLERFLASDLLADLIDLPLFFVIGFLVAWLLASIVTRPVRELTRASEQLAAQHFPEPMKVPPGNDELTQMARSFNLMTASIRGFVERERTFTRYVSHELRTPLSALKAQVESVQLGLARPEEVLPALERNIGRMEEVLGALLAMARSAEHEREEAELLPLLRDVVTGLLPASRERVELRAASGRGLRVADRHLTAQAVRNLLENALRYSDGPVTLGVEAGTSSATIQVVDEGAGVPEGALARLREPFFRASERGQGLGLGLSLVDSISRSLGGTLEFRNRDPGFVATVTLPLASSSGN